MSDNIDDIVTEEKNAPVISKNITDDELKKQLDKLNIGKQLQQLIEISENIHKEVSSLQVESNAKNKNSKSIVLNQLQYLTECLSDFSADFKQLKLSPASYELIKAINSLQLCSNAIKNNIVDIAEANQFLGEDRIQEIARNLSDISKIVKKFEVHKDIIKTGENGLIEALEEYKSTCINKLGGVNELVDGFMTDITKSLNNAQKNIANNIDNITGNARKQSLLFGCSVSLAALIFGAAIGATFILSFKISSLRSEKIALESSIEEKESYSDMLSGVTFQKNRDNTFYIIFDKSIQIRNFTTKNGEQAIGYSR